MENLKFSDTSMTSEDAWSKTLELSLQSPPPPSFMKEESLMLTGMHLSPKVPESTTTSVTSPALPNCQLNCPNIIGRRKGTVAW